MFEKWSFVYFYYSRKRRIAIFLDSILYLYPFPSYSTEADVFNLAGLRSGGKRGKKMVEKRVACVTNYNQ